LKQSTQWYQSAVDQLTRIAAAIQRQHDLDLKRVSSLASDIVESLSRSDQLVVEALAGSSGSQLITNLINVGILATKVGVGLGYYGMELERLALAGLVHDIGLLAVPQSLVTKAGRLTPEERMLIEQHPELGYQALRKLGTMHDWLAEVVRQAHERWNGQGYPNKLKGRQINQFAQIIGVVDVFDALVSPRPYRRRFLPHEAVRELVVVERTAFPREVIKALVEQLSAYPIGTSVRLSTGEMGTVIRVNTRFPLRPVVLIGEGPTDGLAARQVDLSTSPQVTIIETVEPPDVARISFPIRTQVGRKAEPVTSVSDQFSALLQSLDAIANVIQEVVESVAPVRQGVDSLSEGETMWPHRRTAVQELVNASFEKEVVGLFALEAHEWLAQIQRALKKLTEGDNQAVRPKLYGIILQGITNLAKSAATVQLSAIEQMATNLLPILDEVRRQELRPAAATLNWLHEGLARISTAVHRLTNDHAEQPIVQFPNGEDSPIEAPSSHSLSNRQQVATPQPVIQSSEASEPPLLKALRALQQARARSVQPTRDVLEAVILRAEHEAGETGVSVIERILKELHRLDEQVLEDVNRRVPVIIQALHNLRSQETTDSVTASQLDPIVCEVDALYDLANRVQASMMTMFLHGLRSFLLVSAYRKASTLPQWLEMVEARVQTLIPMAEQWVNIGRTERADISEILRA
jgi:HD-GYP domain-containing protein (c-di-GMP phosphodiesterase class II)